MKYVWSLVALLGLLATSSSPTTADAPSSLMARMVALNPGLTSYTAHISSTVDVHNIPFMHPVLEGMYYHKRPSMNKIVITSGLPGMAKQFSKLYPHVPSPSQWSSLYEVAFVQNNAGTTTLRLTPRKHGRVAHITVQIDDANATVSQMRWDYVDGGFAQLIQSFAVIDGRRVVVKQAGHVEFPFYNADIATTLSGYVWNPPISDAFFKDIAN